MKTFYKIGFLILVLIFGYLMISPMIRDFDIGTEIRFFGVGDADSMLIRNRAGTILIDTGYKEDREKLADKLRVLGIRKIDYLILTHPDKDHIGGASHILDNFKIDYLIQTDYKKGSKAEARLEKSLAGSSAKNILVKKDYNFQLGELDILIYAPEEDYYDKSNDYSLVTLIRDRDLNYLFAGDAEEILMGELLEKDLAEIDIYKLPHHGKWNEKSEAVIEKLSPKIGLVTNDSADDRIVAALEGQGADIYYAYDEDIYFYSDGKTIEKR